MVNDIGAQLITYQAMEVQNPLHDIIKEAIVKRNHQQHLKGLAYINRLEIEDY